VVVRHGDPATEVVRQVHANGHDLLVTAVNGDAGAGGLFGSISRSLLRICPCPVWLLKPEIHGDFDVVLAAVDMREPDEAHARLNREILGLASSLANHKDTTLHVVSAWDLRAESSPGRGSREAGIDAVIAAQESLIQQRVMTSLQSLTPANRPPHLHIRHGNPASIVRSVADEIEADLLVMGTVCRTGAGALLIGTTAENVLDLVTCSILALKPAGFVSPVELAAKS
jgi:nucleotide-binding universal stress UspA family protein